MVTHSSVLAGEIPQMEEPGRLQSTELQRVGHNLATKHTHECIMLSKKKEKVKQKSYKMQENLYTKCPEKANPERQKAD